MERVEPFLSSLDFLPICWVESKTFFFSWKVCSYNFQDAHFQVFYLVSKVILRKALLAYLLYATGYFYFPLENRAVSLFLLKYENPGGGLCKLILQKIKMAINLEYCSRCRVEIYIQVYNYGIN